MDRSSDEGSGNPWRDVIIPVSVFILSVITLTILLGAILVLMLPVMKQRAKKLDEQRGFHGLVYAALVCGHIYVALMSAAAGVAPEFFCSTKYSSLLILLLQLMVAPVSAQVLFLWAKLKKEKPLVAEQHHRKLWTRAASRVAYLQIAATLAVVLALILVDGTDAANAADAADAADAANASGGCVGSGAWDFAAFSDAFTGAGVERRAERSLLQALWLLTLVPLLLSYPLLCRVGHSNFIPLFGDAWKKLHRLSSALAVALLWQLLCLFVEDPTVRLVALCIEVEALTLFLALLLHSRAIKKTINKLLPSWWAHSPGRDGFPFEFLHEADSAKGRRGRFKPPRPAAEFDEPSREGAA